MENAQKKAARQKQQKELEKKKEELEAVMSPEMAEMTLKMERLLKTAATMDSASEISEDPEANLEMVEELEEESDQDTTEKLLDTEELLTEDASQGDNELDITKSDWKELIESDEQKDRLDIIDQIEQMREKLGVNRKEDEKPASAYAGNQTKLRGYVVDTQI